MWRQQRLHQASFREAVIAAYNGRCALSGLPEPLLLDAAHIVADRNELLGQPIIPNGVPLSKIHHAAFDGLGTLALLDSLLGGPVPRPPVQPEPGAMGRPVGSTMFRDAANAS